MSFSCMLRSTAVLGLTLASGLSAQHGTGRAGVAAPGAAAGSLQRSAPAAHPSRGVQTNTPNLGGRPYPIRTDIPTPIGLNAPAASYTGILPGALKSTNGYPQNGGYSRRGNSRGFAGFLAPWYLPPYFDTGISTFPGYNDTVPPPPDSNAQATAESQEALAQQIQQLTDEVQQMKNSIGQQQGQPPASAPPANAAPERRPPTPPITLVLRDGQQLSVESYAVMNQTFWNFSKRPVQKIPVADIDLAASVKATEANGGEFPQIGSLQ